MDQVLLLSILIKKDLEDTQKVQIKETIEKNIVDKEEDNIYILKFMFYILLLLSIVFSFFIGYKYGKKSKEFKITYRKEDH